MKIKDGSLLKGVLVVTALLMVFLFSQDAKAETFEWRNAIDVPEKYIRDVMKADLTDLECMALNIYHEARGEKLLGQQLVAKVTMNRMEHSGFPDTICGVVRQDQQFSWTHDGRIDHPTDRQAYEDAYFIAISFLVLGYDIDVNYSELLLNYHASRVNPGWFDLQPVMVYGSHVFYIRKRDLN